MTTWTTVTSMCGRGAWRPGWVARALLLTVLIVPSWPAHTQERVTVSAESGVGAGAPEWKRLQAEAERLYEEGRYKEAIPVAKRAILLAEDRDGEHAGVADILNQLAVLYKQLGRYAEAEPLYLRALRIQEKTLGNNHPEVAASLNNLAVLYEVQGHYIKAVPLHRRALGIWEKELGPDHPKLATGLNNLAAVYYRQGQHREAEPLYVRSLEIRENALGPEHPDVAISLSNLSTMYLAQGRYREAGPLYQRALRIWERALGNEHPYVATGLNNLAVLYHVQGRYEEAIPLLERALRIREKALGMLHPEVGWSLSNLAGLYQRLGRYAAAEPLLESALAIREKALGPEHPDVAVTLSNLAQLYQMQGRYRDAKSLLERALSIREKALGAHHPNVALSLNNLAVLHEANDGHEDAEPLLHRALRIWEEALGPTHPDVALGLSNLAAHYQARARYREAESLFERSLAIREDVLGPNHPDVAASLNNLAKSYQGRGRYVEAENLYVRALGIWENALGEHHPNLTMSLTNLAVLYWAQKKFDQAISHAERAERASDEHLSAMMRHGSEQQKHAFMAMDIREVDKAVTLALHVPGDARAQRLAMRHLLRRKGRVLDAMRSTLAAVRGHMDEEGRALLDRYDSVRSQYATQYLRGPQGIAPEQHRANLAELEQQKRELEVALNEKSSQFAEVSRNVTLEDVHDALPADAALVEWIRYEPFDPTAREKEREWQPPRYAACVLIRGREPACVDLGDAGAIDAAALAFHRAVALGLEARAPARALDTLILAPVRRMLGGARKLYLSPDGALQFIPFAALRHRDDTGRERYLIEAFELVYVTSGRDLVRGPRADAPRGPVTVLGDPRYGVPGTLSIQRFPRLPGTHREAEEIGALFADARVLTGADAREAAIKGARAPSILHLATHAYFGARDCAGQPQDAANPLLATGLALAGADACDDASGGDGVLTGEELAALDLSGTQLVVLSACDTGIGALALGDENRLLGARDGVYGLRRALMLAGAETQVVSLWKVNDLATQELMAGYYRELLHGRGRADALRRVQLAMLRGLERAHPYYWASFAVVGMDAPLRLPARPARPRALRGPGALRGPRGCACNAGAGSRTPGWAGLVLAPAVVIALRRRPRARAARSNDRTGTRPGPHARLAAMVLVVFLAACAGRQPGRSARAISDEEAAGRALEWTLGPTRAPPPRGRARLLWRVDGEPLERARPVTSCQEGVHSILPRRDGSRVYLVIDGAIVFVDTSERTPGAASEARATPLMLSPPGVRVRRLLAFARERRQPIILAHAEEGETARETLWLFRIQGREAVGERVERYADFADAAAFHRRYDNPRCHAAGRDCVVISAYDGDTIVSVEATHGRLPRTELAELRGAGVRDVAWARGASARAQWVLRQCGG